MLARKSRLHKQTDIIETIRKGRRLRTPSVLIYVYKPDPLPDNAKVATVVGKKVHKSAVKRHKFQRWLREVAREVINDISPCHMVWVGLPSLKEVSSQEELKNTLESSWQKLHDLSNDA